MSKVEKKNWVFIKLVVLFCFALFSCKSTSVSQKEVTSAPDWILNPAAKYNSSLYITHVGTGRDRDAAQTSALSGIASVFGQSVNSVMTSKEVVSQTDTTYEHNRQIEQNILREIDQNEMLGVSVDNFWFDGNSTWYALAAINRMEAASLYESRIVNNNLEIYRLMESAENEAAQNPMIAYARYNSAASLAADNDVYITRLSVLSSLRGEMVRENSISGVAIRNKMREVLQNIPIAVQVSGDADSTLTAICEQVFSNQGFATTTMAGSVLKPRYLFEANYQSESSPNSVNTIIYCRYSLVGYVVDLATGQRLLPLSITGREGASYKEEAERRALANVKKNIAEQFNIQFSSYLSDLH